MMRRATYVFTILFSIVLSGPAYSQSGEVFDGTIESQLNTLVDRSFPYESFKGIRPSLPQLRKNVLDSLDYYKGQRNKELSTINIQQSTIDSLQADIANKDQDLKVAIEERDSFSFLGMKMSKAGYSTFMWMVVGLLVLALLFFIYQYRNNIVTARESKKDLATLRDEFDSHRKRALEREQKLKRDLQDELNKSAR